MEVIRRLASSSEDKAVEALELFDELIDSEIAILLPHIRPLIKLCLEAIVKHKLIPELLDVLFPIMEEVSPGDLDQAEEKEEDERSCQSPSACAAQLIDTMALHLPPEKLLPPLVGSLSLRWANIILAIRVVVGCNLRTTAHRYDDRVIHARFLADSKLRLPASTNSWKVSAAVTK
ncbi:hypothetical protein HPB50_011016 [Hyalomma asiaticum]|uniref:Uncharacterized protein n=1 Tax=Hyalomma asiaticum TaxID=266040 RepID=A0ACB7TIQ8_HYAAI|nr:hypothetical protein HPB50_011016 [Hyalomma asiaticum]